MRRMSDKRREVLSPVNRVLPLWNWGRMYLRLLSFVPSVVKLFSKRHIKNKLDRHLSAVLSGVLI